MMYRIGFRGVLVLVLVVTAATGIAAGPLDELEEALRGQGFSSSQAASIVAEADGAFWEEISPEVDFAAVVRSLTVNSLAERLNPEDLADLARGLSQEADTLRRLGFTRREVARALSEGVRGARSTEALVSNVAASAMAAASGISRSHFRRDIQEITGRRGPSRGVIPSGVAQRILDGTLPRGGPPGSDASDNAEEAPDTPRAPRGR